MANEYSRYLLIQEKGSPLRIFLSALTIINLYKELVLRIMKTMKCCPQASEDFSQASQHIMISSLYFQEQQL